MTTTDITPAPIHVLHLWGEPSSECGICEQYGPHRHAVGWYCGPVKEDIGQPVPKWGPDAIAAGRTVCRTCHDRFYGIEPSAERQETGSMRPSRNSTSRSER
jgi:hypothetical protein